MDFEKGGTSCTAGTAKDNGWTYNNCGQVDHISRICANHDLTKNLLEHPLVRNDVPNIKSGCRRTEEKKGTAPTSQKKSGRLAAEEEVNQETGSEVESELVSLSDSDSEKGKAKWGQ